MIGRVMSVGSRPAAAGAVSVDAGEGGSERETLSGHPGGTSAPTGRPAAVYGTHHAAV